MDKLTKEQRIRVVACLIEGNFARIHQKPCALRQRWRGGNYRSRLELERYGFNDRLLTNKSVNQKTENANILY